MRRDLQDEFFIPLLQKNLDGGYSKTQNEKVFSSLGVPHRTLPSLHHDCLSVLLLSGLDLEQNDTSKRERAHFMPQKDGAEASPNFVAFNDCGKLRGLLRQWNRPRSAILWCAARVIALRWAKKAPLCLDLFQG